MHNAYVRGALTYVHGSHSCIHEHKIPLQLQNAKCAVIPGSVAAIVWITRPNSKSMGTMLLRFGYVFVITILAPEPRAFAQKNVFQLPTIQKCDNVRARSGNSENQRLHIKRMGLSKI